MAARLPARAALRARPESAPRPLLHAVLLDHDPATRGYAAELQFYAADRGLDVFLHTDTAPTAFGKPPQPLSAAAWPDIVRTSPAHFVVGVSTHGRLTRTVRARGTDTPLSLEAACDAALAAWWDRVGDVIKDTLVRNPNVVPPAHLDALLSAHAAQKSIRRAVALLARTADACRDWQERYHLAERTSGTLSREARPLSALPASPLSSESSPTVPALSGVDHRASAPDNRTHVISQPAQTTRRPRMQGTGVDDQVTHDGFQSYSRQPDVPQARQADCPTPEPAVTRMSRSAMEEVSISSGSASLPNAHALATGDTAPWSIEPPRLRSGPSSRWLHHSDEWSARIIRAQLRACTVHRALLSAFSAIASLPVSPAKTDVVNLRTHLPSEGHRQRLLRELNDLIPRVEELGARLCWSPCANGSRTLSDLDSQQIDGLVESSDRNDVASACKAQRQTAGQTRRRPRRQGRPFAATAAPWLSYVRSLERSDCCDPVLGSIAGCAGQSQKILAGGGWRCALCRSVNWTYAECCVACRAPGVPPAGQCTAKGFEAGMLAKLGANLKAAFDPSAFPWIILPPNMPQTGQLAIHPRMVDGSLPAPPGPDPGGAEPSNGLVATDGLEGHEEQHAKLQQAYHYGSYQSHQQHRRLQPGIAVGFAHAAPEPYADIRKEQLTVSRAENRRYLQSEVPSHNCTTYPPCAQQYNGQQQPFDLSEALYAASIDDDSERMDKGERPSAPYDISSEMISDLYPATVSRNRIRPQSLPTRRDDPGVASRSSSTSPVYVPGSSPASSPPEVYLGTGSPIMDGLFMEEGRISGSSSTAVVSAPQVSIVQGQQRPDLATYPVSINGGFSVYQAREPERLVDHEFSTPIPVPVAGSQGSLPHDFSGHFGSMGFRTSPNQNGGGCVAEAETPPLPYRSRMDELGAGSVEANDAFPNLVRKRPMSLPVAVPGAAVSSPSNSADANGQASSLHALAAASDAANGGQGAATMESLAAVSVFMGGGDDSQNHEGDGVTTVRGYAMF